MSNDRPDYGVLNVTNAICLGAIITAAHAGQKVAFLDEKGDVTYGTARHIVTAPDNFGFLRHDEDVRGGYLRTTMQSGFERTDLVADLIDGLNETFFMDVSA